MVEASHKIIHHALISWYQENARALPWRENQDPYLVWISEVMLQQTQVETVVPYFLKWRDCFPDVFILSRMSEETILKAWEGLGYYSRARNIKKSADIIVEKFEGKIPDDLNTLKSLPGIGEYIAAAILSIAFKRKYPALEANGMRVLSRLFNYHGQVGRSSSKRVLKDHLAKIVQFERADLINQAIMDLGSMICITKHPQCEACPVMTYCLAHAHNTQHLLPKKKKKKTIPHIDVVAAVILNDGKVLITKRMPDKLLGGLWEFPGGKVEKGETKRSALRRELIEEIDVETEIGDKKGVYQHAYTHFSVTVSTYTAKITSGKVRKLEVADYRWIDIDALETLPMGKVDRLISRDLQSELDADLPI